ncbi:MAG: hypothetical protein H6718_15765 [Polyangiaceae bacterium]|nr:hypothetical protein [Polyangiaceae bacterium]
MRTFTLVCAVALTASVLGASGCSVINSFDDLKQEATAGAGGSGASGGTAGQGGSSGGGSGGAGATAGTGGSAGAGGSLIEPGLVVVAAEGTLTAGGRGLVVAALDPRTGEEFTRKEFGANKNGFVAYDREAGYWYVWTQEGGATDLYTFHVWTFNRSSGEFDEEGTASVPAPAGVIAVLNKRVLYWSVYKEGASAPTQGFTVINVDNPQSPAPTTPLQDIPTFASPLAAIPRANGSDAGGSLNLFIKSSTCAPDGVVDENGSDVNMCEVQRVRASLSASSPKPGYAGSPLVIGKVRQSGGSISAVEASNDDAVAFPDPLWVKGVSTNTAGKVTRFNATNFNVNGSVNFEVGGSFIRGAAWDPCNKIYFATESLEELAIFAIPTGTTTGTPFRQSIGSVPVGAVFFDQYTRTLILPRGDQANFELRAFLLGGDATSPTLTERDANSSPPWDPPADLRPLQMEVETPAKQFCTSN